MAAATVATHLHKTWIHTAIDLALELTRSVLSFTLRLVGEDFETVIKTSLSFSYMERRHNIHTSRTQNVASAISSGNARWATPEQITEAAHKRKDTCTLRRVHLTEKTKTRKQRSRHGVDDPSRFSIRPSCARRRLRGLYFGVETILFEPLK